MKSTASLKDIEQPAKFYRNKDMSKIHEDYLLGIKKSCKASSDLNFIVIPHEISEYNPKKIELPSAIRVNWIYLTLDYRKLDWYIYDCDYVRYTQ
jgi:hypothetical protein